jgi:hypothetical protein
MAKQTFTTGQVLLASQLSDLQQTAMLGGSASAKTASYTLAAADAGTFITMSSTSSTTITVNSGLFAAGDIVTILNNNSGTCTITAGTATVSKPTNATLALVQNAGGVLYFTATGAATFMPFDVGNAATTASAVGVSLSNTGNYTIATGAITALTFDSELFDTDSFHSTSTNTSRITIPSGKAGKYVISVVTYFDPNATGARATYIRKNGANINFVQGGYTASGTLAAGQTISLTADLAVGDYIEAAVFQNSGGNLTVYGTNVHFSAMYLGA